MTLTTSFYLYSTLKIKPFILAFVSSMLNFSWTYTHFLLSSSYLYCFFPLWSLYISFYISMSLSESTSFPSISALFFCSLYISFYISMFVLRKYFFFFWPSFLTNPPKCDTDMLQITAISAALLKFNSKITAVICYHETISKTSAYVTYCFVVN